MATVCLDNNFVSDYLASAEYTRMFLSGFGPEDAVLLPTIVWFEALTPAFRTGEGRTLSRVRSALSGFQTVDFDYDAAEEAAAIRGELLDRGEPLGAPDVLIAGIARRHEADLVTADGAFERVPNLSVLNPRADQ
jgi:predicted nucleic acid-binding protein